MRFKLFIAIFLLLAITGCSANRSETELNVKLQPAPATITLTPVELFKGEAAKLKPFFGSSSGAFKLKYEGSKPTVSLDIEIWNNGRKVDSAGSVGDLFFSTAEQKSGEVEVVVSVDIVSIDGKDEFSTIRIGTGSSLATITIPWDNKLTGRSWIQDTGQRSFTDLQPVRVFGMVATSSNSMRTGGLTTEDLNQTEWALVFALRFDKQSGNELKRL